MARYRLPSGRVINARDRNDLARQVAELGLTIGMVVLLDDYAPVVNAAVDIATDVTESLFDIF